MRAYHSYSKVCRLSVILPIFILFVASIYVPVEAHDPALSDHHASPVTKDHSGSTGPVRVDMQMVRVATAGEGEVVVMPGSNYSSFNLDSTQFLIKRDGRTNLYKFDPTTLSFNLEGSLFDKLELEGSHWSALSGSTVFGVAQDENDRRPQIFSYDLNNRSYSLLKDFSAVVPAGVVGGFTKARTNDDRFAFAWRESNLSAWRYIIVWDRASDAIKVFDLSDPIAGINGYRDSYLNESGSALVVRGDVNRVWRHLFQAQNETGWVDSDAELARLTASKATSTSNLDTGSELWRAGPRHVIFERYDSDSAVWDVLPYQSGNQSRDGRLFIFNAASGGSNSDVFIATTITAEAMDQITWTNLVNCSATDNTIAKTSGRDNAEDSGATTLQSIESGNGFIEFVASDKTTLRTCGFLSAGISPPAISDFDYAIQLSSGKKAFVYEHGVVKAKINYKPNNTFRVSVEGDVVKYYKNGEVFYTSGVAPSYPLIGAASLVTTVASVTKAMMAGGTVVPRVKLHSSSLSMTVGSSAKFSATVTGTTNNQINWSATGGSITSDGTYTAPGTPGQYTITASSVGHPAVTDSALVGVAAVGAAIASQYVEAETGVLGSPMMVGSDSLATGGQFVSSATPYSGTATYNVPVSSSGTYYLWGRVLSPNDSSDSFYISIDGAADQVYDSAEGLWSTSWQWTQIKGRDASGLPAKVLLTFVENNPAGGTHTIKLSGRDPNTKIDRLFITNDPSAVPSSSTPPPPVITAVASSGVTPSGATISWTTNTMCDTQVEYGATTSYGSSSTLNRSMVTSHSQALTGSSANTMYHYRVKSRDTSGNLATSSDFTFTTTAASDTTPPVVSSVAASGITPNGANVTWSTNEGSDTQVDYGTTTAYGSSSSLSATMVTTHSSALSGLSVSTLYHYRAKSRDAAGNLATSSDFTFTTSAAPDTTPPVISSVAASGITVNGANVTWSTNEGSDTQADYGTTTAYGSSSTLSPTTVTTHSSALSGLSAGTLYHFRAKSRDAAGNLALSGDFTFTTAVAPDTTPPVISSVASSGMSTSAATIAWTTNEGSDSQAEYGPTTSYGSSSPLPTPLVTGHTLSLTGLTASTTYNYRVKSRDAAGNLAVSGNFTFTTATPSGSSQYVEGETAILASPMTVGSDPLASGGQFVWSSTQESGTATYNVSVSSAGTYYLWGRVLSPNDSSDSFYVSIDGAAEQIYDSAQGLWSTNWQWTQIKGRNSSGLAAQVLLTFSGAGNHTVKLRGRDANTKLDRLFITNDPNAVPSGSTPPPPVITAVSTSGVTSSGGTINWTTNVASDTQVEYGTTTSYGTSSALNASMVTSHSQALSGLSGGTLYHYRVKSRDAAGNLGTSTDFTFTTTAAPDTTPPVISAVASSGITVSGATITWSTNEGSDTQVDYGTTTAYGSSSVLNTSLVTSHSASVSGLATGTLYHYRVKSRDAAGNLATSADFTLTTLTTADTTPPVISAVSSSGISSSGATITWSTNEASDTQVDYGTTTAYGSSSTLNSSLVTSHSVALSGLSASTLYHYRVKSRDAAGNLATSGDFSLTTAAALPPPTGNFFVAINGSDTNPGTLALPFRTINRGIQALSSGQTLIIRSGTYNESIGITRSVPSGTSWSNVTTIKSSPGETVTLAPTTGTMVAIFTADQYIVLDGFIFDGGRITTNGVKVTGTSHHIRIKNSEVKNAINSGVLVSGPTGTQLNPMYVELINLDIHHNGSSDQDHEIYFSKGTSYNLIDNCKLHDGPSHGLQLWNNGGSPGGDGNIVKNTVAYNLDRGFGIYGGLGNQIINSIAYNNSLGIFIRNDAGDVRGTLLYNNTLYANTIAGISIQSNNTATTVRNNICYSNPTNFLDSTGSAVSSNNLLGVDPRFVNVSTKDFHLQTGSPAINAGMTLSQVTTDKDGVARPQGGAYDIGPYER